MPDEKAASKMGSFGFLWELVRTETVGLGRDLMHTLRLENSVEDATRCKHCGEWQVSGTPEHTCHPNTEDKPRVRYEEEIETRDELLRKFGDKNAKLRGIILALKRGDCWCEKAVDNPMATSHSEACVLAREALQ